MQTEQSSQCPEAVPFFESQPFRYMLLYNIFICTSAVILNFIFVFRHRNNTLLPRTIKIIVIVYIVCKTLETTMYGGIRVIHFFMYVTSTSPCDILVDKKICLPATFTQTVLISAPTFLHLAMALERLVAFVFSKRNKASGIFVSYILVFLAILSGASSVFYGFQHAIPKGKTPFCAILTTATLWDTVKAIAFYVVVEVFAICLSVITYFVRKRHEKRRTYDIKQRYRKNENSYVFGLMLPWMVLHFTFFIFFYAVVIIVTNMYDLETHIIGLFIFFGFVNIQPIYTFILPFFLAWIVRKQRNSRQSAINSLITQDTSAEAYLKTYGWN